MTKDQEIEAVKAALAQSDLDYQNLSEKYGELLEQKRCDCGRIIEMQDE